MIILEHDDFLMEYICPLCGNYTSPKNQCIAYKNSQVWQSADLQKID